MVKCAIIVRQKIVISFRYRVPERRLQTNYTTIRKLGDFFGPLLI